MRALITGGAGFIGSHLAEELLRKGDAVHVIDDLSTGDKENIVHLKSRPRFSLTVDTVINHDILTGLIEEADIVYHLAALVGVKLIMDRPIKSLTTNIQGTENVLELAARCGNKKVVIASTSEIYGRNGTRPYREDADRLLGPVTKSRWSYSTAKAIDEHLALAYSKEKGLPVVIVRIFNTVGPRQTGRYGMVIPRFVKQALSGEPITVYGDGSQQRCFAYVEDVVKGIVALSRHPEAVGEIFNIGTSREVTIEDLAKMVKRVTGSRSPIVHIPYQRVYGEGFEDMPYRMPDLARIKRLIDYEPSVNLEEIILRVADYFKDSPEALEKEKY